MFYFITKQKNEPKRSNVWPQNPGSTMMQSRKSRLSNTHILSPVTATQIKIKSTIAFWQNSCPSGDPSVITHRNRYLTFALMQQLVVTTSSRLGRFFLSTGLRLMSAAHSTIMFMWFSLHLCSTDAQSAISGLVC